MMHASEVNQERLFKFFRICLGIGFLNLLLRFNFCRIHIVALPGRTILTSFTLGTTFLFQN